MGLAQHGEESAQALLGAVFGDVQEPLAADSGVIDQRQVLVIFVPRDLGSPRCAGGRPCQSERLFGYASTALAIRWLQYADPPYL